MSGILWKLDYCIMIEMLEMAVADLEGEGVAGV